MKQENLRTKLTLAITLALTITIVTVTLAWPKENLDIQVESFQQTEEALTVRIIPDTNCANLIKTEQDGEIVRCTFLSIPGITAKDEFTIPTDGVTEVAFNRPDGTYEPVLAMTDDGDFRYVCLEGNSFVLKDAP